MSERFIPQKSNIFEMQVNIERYLYALKFCDNAIVVDAGCGAGFGTYLYSLIAEKVIAVDYKQEAFDSAKQYPINKDKVRFKQVDLEKDILPHHDVTIALEIIEHLENPDFFLSQLKCKTLVYSIPLDSKSVCPEWHKQDFKTIQEIRELINRYFEIKHDFIQYNKWVIGHAIRL